MTEPKAEPARPARESSGLIRDVGLWLGAVIASGGLVFWLLDGLRVRDWLPFRHTLAGPDMYDLTRSTVALTGLLGATVAVALAIRRQRSTEQTVRITAEAQLVTAQAYALDVERNSHEQVRDLRERFTTAAGQLGNDAPAVRLAGIYAMAGLADDWLQREQPEEAQCCIDVLCAYIRTPRRTRTDEDARADLEVRQTIIRTITNRLQPGDRTTRDWRGRDFDFTGATFDGSYTLTGAHFISGTLRFDGADFAGGSVDFEHAGFAGGQVTFVGAKFAGSTVAFDYSQFSGGNVTFNEAHFTSGQVYFFDAKFTGSTVIFDEAKVDGGDVLFYGAEFAGGIVSFVGVGVTGGEINFFGADFAGSTLTFRYSHFLGGTLDFSSTRITAGSITFNDSEFDGGTVTFGGSKLVASGPWGERPPSIWPPPDGE